MGCVFFFLFNFSFFLVFTCKRLQDQTSFSLSLPALQSEPVDLSRLLSTRLAVPGGLIGQLLAPREEDGPARGSLDAAALAPLLLRPDPSQLLRSHRFGKSVRFQTLASCPICWAPCKMETRGPLFEKYQDF